MLRAVPSSLNSAPCPCASLLSQRARCGWIRDRALPTHPAGEALPRVPRPRERERGGDGGGGSKMLGQREERMNVNERRWKKKKTTTKQHWEFWILMWTLEESTEVKLQEGKENDHFCHSFPWVYFFVSQRKATSSQWGTSSLSDDRINPVPFPTSRGHYSSTDWAEWADRGMLRLRDGRLWFMCSWVTTLLSQAFFHSVEIFDNSSMYLIALTSAGGFRMLPWCSVHQSQKYVQCWVFDLNPFLVMF